MDWRSIAFDWNRARSFLVTAEEGSLSAAARALGMTQPTLGRQVNALEDELGVALFERVGRGLVLTPSGLELMEHVRAMGEAANRMSLSASGQSQSLEGIVRITADEVNATFTLPPIITKLRRAEPGILIEVISSNDVKDLRRREADIAIRTAPLTDPDLIARKVGTGLGMLYAARSYVQSAGPFETKADLAGAEFVGFSDNAPFVTFLNEAGISVTQANFTVLSDSILVLWEMVKTGNGIGVMSHDVGKAEPHVENVAPWLPPFEFQVWLVAHRELHTNRRVRFVYDWLVEGLTKR
jgi:DNA-binding transcriptional LysR family regulator